MARTARWASATVIADAFLASSSAMTCWRPARLAARSSRVALQVTVGRHDPEERNNSST
ncbi:MAG: hypothetical protein QM804_15035 [Propionicimonas sp.]